MGIYDMMFTNQGLEEAFRKLVAQEDEVGGFLFCTYGAPFDGRKMRKVVNAPRWMQVLTIRHWLVIPNQSDEPHRRYKMWDIEKAFDIARATAHSNTPTWAYALHFHSHPIGCENGLSQADIAFASHWCQQGTYFSTCAVASSYPLRVLCHSIDLSSNGIIPAAKIETGQFYSWREKRFAPFKRK